MANITENTQNPVWANGIYQIETSDPVLGGANGIANRQAKELAARTQWLRTELSKAISGISTNKSSADSAIALKANHATQITAGAGLTGGGNLSANRTITLATPSTLSGSTANWGGNGTTGHTHEIAKATPTLAGVVKLVNTLNSTTTDAALTAAQGKTLSDQIATAISGSLNMRGELVAQNLNDLNGTAHYGVWRNVLNANATTERNYPINRAGTLLVLPSAYKGQQVYFPFDDKGIYIRDTRNNSNPPTWGDWYKISNEQNPKNRSGIDLDTETTAQFFINAKNGYVADVGEEHAGLILGYHNDCSQIIAAGGNLWLRGSDANPISKPEDWSEWKRILDEKNGVMKSDFAVSRATNGYQKLPSGLILQWGVITKNLGSFSGTATFPIAFPNACVHLSSSQHTRFGNNGYVLRTGIPSKTGFSYGEDVLATVGRGTQANMYWFAIGY